MATKEYTFKVGDPVRFRSPDGSFGRIADIRDDGPFKSRPGFYVTWVYGRDTRGDVVTALSGLLWPEALQRVTEEEVLAKTRMKPVDS